ncbi:MAG TPA: hypothetical protein PKL61_12945, partial [Accumulibacter sp.]|nr:hypothetical protein [Accumulibacter sp.]HNL98058.1 hypothetical protein [Accumulibacter sp.]
MTKRKGRKHTPEVEAQLVLATLMSDQTLAERAQQYDIHPNQITDSFRLDAVRDAIRRHGCPEIFNTDQACPFHQRRIHGSTQGARHPDQHGRQEALACLVREQKSRSRCDRLFTHKPARP